MFKSSWEFALENEIFDFKKCIKEPDSYKGLSLKCKNSKKLGWYMLPALVVKVCSLLYSSKKNEDIHFLYHYEQGIYLKKEYMSSKGYQTSSG